MYSDVIDMDLCDIYESLDDLQLLMLLRESKKILTFNKPDEAFVSQLICKSLCEAALSRHLASRFSNSCSQHMLIDTLRDGATKT
jgi:hypothetical protein